MVDEKKISDFKYGISCSLDKTSVDAPIVLRGEVKNIAATAKEIGFDGLEIHLCSPDQFNWDGVESACKANDIEVCALATGREVLENKLSLVTDDANIRRKAVERLKEHIDICARFKAILIVGTMRWHVPEPSLYSLYENRLYEAVLELSDYAQKADVKIVIENILKSTSNWLNSMKEVADFVAKVDRSNVGIHLDTYSMLMEDNNIPKSVEYCGDKLDYVHFSDSGRYYPGGGNIDFKTHTNALLDNNYSGYITIESIPQPTEFDCAKRGLEYLKALNKVIEIERLDLHK